MLVERCIKFSAVFLKQTRVGVQLERNFTS